MELRTYLDADPWLQIDYCRDATRQSVDEDVCKSSKLRKNINLDCSETN